MDRQRRQAVNQIRHLVHSATHVCDRVTELCPPGYQLGGVVGEHDVFGLLWNRAHLQALELVDALEDLVLGAEELLDDVQRQS